MTRRKLRVKKSKITEAAQILERLINAVNLFDARKPVTPHQEEQIIRKNFRSENIRRKTCLPVQFLKGVGPKMAARFAAKKINTVEDLLYFLPAPMKTAGKSVKSTNWKRGKSRPSWPQLF